MKVPIQLTPEWVVEEFEEHGYESAMGSTKTVGAKQVLHNFLKANAMKVSELDNKERWTRIVRFCVPAERKHADPAHYKRFPFRAFYADARFWRHHYAMLFAFVHSTYFQLFLSVVMLFIFHKYSYDLYVKPLTYLGSTVSCSHNPLQFFCAPLKFLQDHSYSGWQDVYKFLVTMGTQMTLSMLARLLVPLQQNQVARA